MRTLTILAAAATALISTVGIAGAPTERSFTRDGRSYVYTAVAQDNGNTLIQGHEVGSNRRFRFVVNGTRVTGQAGGYPVSFRAPQPLPMTATMAAN